MLPPPPGQGAWSVGLSGGGFRNVHESEPHEPGEEPYLHDLRLVTIDATLGARLGIASGLGLEAVLPYRFNRERIRYRTLDGAPFEPDSPDLHHTNRTLSGLADPWVLLHAGTTRGDWALSARLGTTLPLGGTVEDPFALGEIGVAHEHVQFGAGVLSPLLGAAASRPTGFGSITATALGRLGVATNRHGYRPGHQLLVSLLAGSALGTGSWQFAAGPVLYHETGETWGGREQIEGNLGRIDYYLEGRAARTLGGAWGAGAELRVPIHSEVTGAQFEVPVSLRLTLSRTFVLED